jgi:hypothetical protein
MTKTTERLNAMSLQEIFDFVNEQVIKQAKPSWRGELGDCAYRGPNGLKCAAGFLLDDEDFDPDMEGKGARDMCNMIGFRSGHDVNDLDYADTITRKRDLIARMQGAHDGAARCAMDDGEANFVDSFTEKMEHVRAWLNSLSQSR